MSELIYAIDFGTSNSLLAAATRKEAFAPIPLDPIALDPTILRSVLYFPSQKECSYGTQAIEEFKRNDLQGRLIRSIKRFLPIRSFIGTFIETRPMNLEDIIAVFLAEMRRRANQHFNQDVTSVVLGRPARFSLNEEDDQYAQYRLEKAAKNAGFKAIEFFPEPLAAAFELKGHLIEPKTVLVVDFGGGTSDYTILRLGKENFDKSDVLAISGVPIAGDALDGSIMRKQLLPYFGGDVSYTVPFGSNILKMPISLSEKLCTPAEIALLRKRDVIEFFKNVQNWSLTSEDSQKMDRLFCLIEDNLGFDLFEAIERAKKELSVRPETRIQFQYPSVELDQKLTREDFDRSISDPVRKILEALDESLRLAQLSPRDIDLVFCTGGTARVPCLRSELERRFGGEKIKERKNFHSIVEGLAIRAKELSG